MTRLVIPELVADEIRAHLLASDLETAGIIFAESASLDGRPERFLFREFLAVPDEGYARRTGDFIELTPSFIAWVLKRARVNSWAIFFTHTHPWNGTVRPSPIDLEGEKRIFPAVYRQAPGLHHGRIILGRSDYHAALWPDTERSETAVRVFSVGKHYREFATVENKGPLSVTFDRQVRLLGAAGQQILQSLRVGIVGLGGTGSLIAQQLAHLGVRDFVLIDPDTIEESNLNRVVGSTRRDIGVPKTAVGSRLISAIQPSARVTEIQQSVLLNAVARSIISADLFFCCTDSHGSRAVLNQLAYQFYVPGFDLGTQIKVEQDSISSVSGRLQMMSPGLSCLLCSEILDPEQVRRDLLTDFERQTDPYIAGAHEPQPSVISLNSTVASLAVTMFLSACAGFPLDARYQIYRAETGVVRPIASNAQPECIVCSRTGSLGRGDRWDLPGRQVE